MEKSVLKVPKFDEKPKSTRKFVLKYVFKNVANLEVSDSDSSEHEEHFNLKWRMGIRRNERYIMFYLFGQPIAPFEIRRSMEGNLEFSMMGERRNVTKTFKNCFIKEEGRGFPNFLEWKDMKDNYLIYNELNVQVAVEIQQMTGYGKKKIRKFDESQKEVSDCILVVQDTKFYVQKMYLALHSSYFKSLLLGNFEESQKNEIELKDIDPDDFQNFLELIHGEPSLDDDTVSGILQLADMYDAPTAIRRCEEFLLKISLRYNLENLKNKCLSQITTFSDIESIMAANISEMDVSTSQALLQKSLDFSNK